MKNQKIEKVVNPFIRIAGTQALLWGALGLVVSTLLSWLSGYHYHGLLHFGPAPYRILLSGREIPATDILRTVYRKEATDISVIDIGNCVLRAAKDTFQSIRITYQ